MGALYVNYISVKLLSKRQKKRLVSESLFSALQLEVAAMNSLFLSPVLF